MDRRDMRHKIHTSHIGHDVSTFGKEIEGFENVGDVFYLRLKKRTIEEKLKQY